jgi:argininosuccinate lyase
MKRCAEAMTDELHATEEAYKLVKEGIPFRDAYRKIGGRFSGKSEK